MRAIVTPIDFMLAVTLAKERWIAQRKAMLDKLSSERLSYVYIERMELENYQQVYGEVLGTLCNKEALVVDVHFNRGGNLHDQRKEVLRKRGLHFRIAW